MKQIRVARTCYGAGAVVAAVGGLMHGSVYGRVAQALGAAQVSASVTSALEALWLCFAAILLVVAAVLAMLAVRPGAASRGITWLVALIPAVPAVIIYRYMGNFIAGHILIAVAVLTFVGGWSVPRGVEVSGEKENVRAVSN